MSTLNNARTLSAWNAKAPSVTPAAAKANPLTASQSDSSHATFSRLLERSRADAASERHANSVAARKDTPPPSAAPAERHAAKPAGPRHRNQAEAARADDADTRPRASASPHGRGTDSARARADRPAGDEAATESAEATRLSADEEAAQASVDPISGDLMPMPAVVPMAVDASVADAADPAHTDATGLATNPLDLLGKSGGRIDPAGAMGIGGPDAALAAAGNTKDGHPVGLTPPGAAAADPTLALATTTQPAALPEATLAQLATLSGHTGATDDARKLPSALEALPAGSSSALAHPALGHLTRASDTPAIPTATVSTEVTDSGFQEALATQVSVFARGGLSKAELHLNPAELGPVSVQITMNGDQARVDFGADRAQTRQAIEAGWAALAASLQDAGFTLSGGGVSEQAGRQAAEQQAAAQSSRAMRSTAAVASDPPAASIVAARPRAGAALDLYA